MNDHQVLTLHAEVSEEDAANGIPRLQAAIERLPCLTTEVSFAENNVTVTVTFVDEDATDSLLDQIVELIGDIFPSDDDSQPIEFQDSRFGCLIFRDEYSWFVGSFEIPETGDSVDLFIDSTSEAPSQASIDRAKQIADEWPQRRSTVLARVTDNLLGLYNKEWRRLDESDEGPLDASRFCARLSLCSLAIDSGQFVTLGFHADGMFTDHGVTATVSTEDEIDAWVD